jgi:hypothetical protein
MYYPHYSTPVEEVPTRMPMTDPWKQREEEATMLSMLEIFQHTTRNALLVPEATIEEKIGFAMDSLPFPRSDAARFVFDTASVLWEKGEIDSALLMALKAALAGSY